MRVGPVFRRNKVVFCLFVVVVVFRDKVFSELGRRWSGSVSDEQAKSALLLLTCDLEGGRGRALMEQVLRQRQSLPGLQAHDTPGLAVQADSIGGRIGSGPSAIPASSGPSEGRRLWDSLSSVTPRGRVDILCGCKERSGLTLPMRLCLLCRSGPDPWPPLSQELLDAPASSSEFLRGLHRLSQRRSLLPRCLGSPTFHFPLTG